MGSKGTEKLDTFTITLYPFSTLSTLSSQAGPDLQLWGEGGGNRGNQNVEVLICNNKFRLFQLLFIILYNI
jgi:hypothetical protein